MLNLLARDQATTDRWAVAEATYQEAIALARETEQRTDLAFGLAGLAWLQARRGREAETRALAAEAHPAVRRARSAAVRGVGDRGARRARARARRRRRRGRALRGISGAAARARDHRRRPVARGRSSSTPTCGWGAPTTPSGSRAEFMAAAEAKGQPWSLARALRCRGLVAGDADHRRAVRAGAPLPRRRRSTSSRPRARDSPTASVCGAPAIASSRASSCAPRSRRSSASTPRPWAERARTELAATGETLRRRDPSTIDELTPQELQIALLLAGGRTTREAAAAAVPQPEDDRVPPAPRLPEARHPLARGARARRSRRERPGMVSGSRTRSPDPWPTAWCPE